MLTTPVSPESRSASTRVRRPPLPHAPSRVRGQDPLPPSRPPAPPAPGPVPEPEPMPAPEPVPTPSPVPEPLT